VLMTCVGGEKERHSCGGLKKLLMAVSHHITDILVVSYSRLHTQSCLLKIFFFLEFLSFYSGFTG